MLAGLKTLNFHFVNYPVFNLGPYFMWHGVIFAKMCKLHFNLDPLYEEKL